LFSWYGSVGLLFREVKKCNQKDNKKGGGLQAEERQKAKGKRGKAKGRDTALHGTGQNFHRILPGIAVFFVTIYRK
jgi:hypothetical protein